MPSIVTSNKAQPKKNWHPTCIVLLSDNRYPRQQCPRQWRRILGPRGCNTGSESLFGNQARRCCNTNILTMPICVCKSAVAFSSPMSTRLAKAVLCGPTNPPLPAFFCSVVSSAVVIHQRFVTSSCSVIGCAVCRLHVCMVAQCKSLHRGIFVMDWKLGISEL